MRRVFLAGVLLVATEATGLRAQSEIGTEFNPYALSDTIVVTANRLGTSVRETASSITVITAEEIERSQATMVAELLRTVPGVDIVQSGGIGQQTSVFLRGANSEHTLILIDGVELNDPSSPGGTVDLANLPVGNIERIEILRGPQSVLYGSDAVGGVIQIFTRRGRGGPTVTISSEGGAFGTFREQLSVMSHQADVNFSVTFARQDSDGISAASELRGGQERDGYGNSTLSASFDLRPSEKIELRFCGRLTEAEADLDQASDVPDDPNYTMKSKERHFSSRLTHQVRDGVWSQRFGAYLTYYQRSATDYVDENHPFAASKSEYQGRRVKFDWQHAIRPTSFSIVTIGAESEQIELEQSLFYRSMYGDYSPPPARDVQCGTTGLYVLDRLEVGDRWYTTLGLRWDDHEMFGSKATYRVTTAYLVDKLDLKLKGSYGTGFKAPTLFQLFDPNTGNPDLKPEISEGWEIGFQTQLFDCRLSLGATWFSNGFDDLIRFDASVWKSMNVAEASTSGVELFVESRLAGALLRADYTYARARERAGDLALLRRPENKVSLTLCRQVTDRLNLNVGVRHVGRRQDMDFAVWPAERAELAAYTVMNLAGRYDVSSRLQLRGRVDNLLDAAYEEVLGFGSAPRAAYLGLRLTL